MGAWGAGSFENDDAGDWVWELEESGVDAIRDALDAVATDDYIEAPECSSALAAAEVVAAALGHPAKDLPDEVMSFIDSDPQLDNKLLKLARDAVKRILSDKSELRELWEESDDYDEWRSNVEALAARLRLD